MRADAFRMFAITVAVMRPYFILKKNTDSLCVNLTQINQWNWIGQRKWNIQCKYNIFARQLLTDMFVNYFCKLKPIIINTFQQAANFTNFDSEYTKLYF